jgi:hypothetical protein
VGVDRDLFESDDQAFEARARHDRGNPFADAAEAAEKRGRGRPPGALNVKTRDFERYYAAMGYRDPLKAMAEWLTADPVALQAWFEEHEKAQVAVGKSIRTALPQLLDIIKEQHACAVALAPYLHGKKPVQVEIIDERLPSLIIDLGTNQLDQARQLAADRALSVGQPAQIEGEAAADPASNEINDLDEGE